MAESYTCDNHTDTHGQVAVSPRRGAIGWLEVSRIGIDVHPLGADEGPWMFCSFYCLCEWARDASRRVR